MKFTKFNSIENAYRDKFVNSVIEQGQADGEWQVTEKIHGSNFSLWTDGETVEAGKRSGFLGEGVGRFYRADLIVARYQDEMLRMFDALKTTQPSKISPMSHIAVRGEIYGGAYDHPDVEKIQGISKVQKGVHYCADVGFAAFDVQIFVEGDEEGQYLSADGVIKVADMFDIPVVPELFRGTMKECLEYSNEFPTTVPEKLHGLPPIEGNVCEGIVIKPVDPRFLWSGQRVILKSKNTKFKEKEKVPKRERKAPVVYSEEVRTMMDELISYVTENRLRNVLSKMGPVTNKDFGKIMGELNKDAIEDFIKDNGEEFEKLSKEDRKKVTKGVGRFAAELLRSNFMNVVDGEF